MARWRIQPVLAALLCGLLALPPRVSGLADYLTTDEAYHWIDRVGRFGAALASGDLARTSQTGHPGVTVMWLGWLGAQLQLVVGQANVSLLEHLAWLRLPHALLSAALIGCGVLLLARLFGTWTALAAGALWATSPYLIAHDRLLHLDSLLTWFVTLCVLTGTLAGAHGGSAAARLGGGGKTGPGIAEPSQSDTLTDTTIDRRPLKISGWLVLSGVFAGLALLTKGPALILLPFCGLLLLGLRLGVPKNRGAVRQIAAVLPSVVGAYLVWLGVALAVVFLLWPALWVAPGVTLANYVEEIVTNGGRPNGDGQFLLGRAVADPGPLFYPLANLFRTTPPLLLGLILAAAAGVMGVFRRAASARRAALLALLALVLFWTLVMTAGPKKFDRYVLPTWPALCVLAGFGLVWGARWLARRGASGRWLALAGGAGLLALELAGLARLHPYYLSAYNLLLGGGPVAERSLLIGWGEGMDQVGAYLRARPDIQGGQVLSPLPETLQPFVPVPVRALETIDAAPANYAVVYLEWAQRGADPALLARLRQTAPLHTVMINGIRYAQIYQLPRPFVTPVGASFGDALRLAGVTVTRSGGTLTVTPAWDVRAPVGRDLQLFVHVLDAQGQRVAQADLPPGGAGEPQTSAWEVGRQIAVPIALPLRPDLPAGTYRVVLGLYDPRAGRIAPSGGTLADPASAGPDALEVGRMVLP